VLEQENVQDWIVKPPNFKLMSVEELSAVKVDLIGVANSIRTLRVNLMTATKEAEGMHKLADGIPSHIYKSANDILRMSAASISSSVWELHLAMEKSLKILVRQKGGNPGNTHNLTNLLGKANSLKEVSIDPCLLRDLPSHHDAISHRYGEAPEMTIDRALANYRLSLTVVTEVTAALSRKFFMKNARFLIKLPPWQS
jgi:HEPN domain-containing protein